MQVHGHAMWGHDFKMIVDPYGDSTGFHHELNRFNDKQREDWLAAYTSENEEFKSKYHSLTDKEIALWKYNRYIKDYLRTIKSIDDGVGNYLIILRKQAWQKIPLWSIPPTRVFYLGEHGWFDKGSCMKNHSGLPVDALSQRN